MSFVAFVDYLSDVQFSRMRLLVLMVSLYIDIMIVGGGLGSRQRH